MSEPAPQGGQTPEDWWERRAEAFEAWADAVDAADLQPLDTRALQEVARLADLRDQVDAAIVAAVCKAREQQSTWSEIAAMLGVTKQAAHRKYARVLVDSPDTNDHGDGLETARVSESPATDWTPLEIASSPAS